MMKFISLFIFVSVCMIGPAEAFECSGTTYSGQSFEKPLSKFTPYDKIFVKVTCQDLDVGEYTMHVNWVHSRKGLVRTGSHNLTVDTKEAQQVYFWFKLSKKGPLKSAITNQDFYEEHFGEWVVQGYVNDEPVSLNVFTVSY